MNLLGDESVGLFVGMLFGTFVGIFMGAAAAVGTLYGILEIRICTNSVWPVRARTSVCV